MGGMNGVCFFTSLSTLSNTRSMMRAPRIFGVVVIGALVVLALWAARRESGGSAARGSFKETVQLRRGGLEPTRLDFA